MYSLAIIDGSEMGLLISFATFAAATVFMWRARRRGWRVAMRFWP